MPVPNQRTPAMYLGQYVTLWSSAAAMPLVCRELYAEADELPPGADEPEERRRLRERRLAEKHAKMKAALMEKQSKEEEEASRRTQQQSFKAAHRERIDVWKNKNKVSWAGEQRGRGSTCVLLTSVGRAVHPVLAWLMVLHVDKHPTHQGMHCYVANYTVQVPAVSMACQLTF